MNTQPLADQDLDTIQHPIYGTLKFPKTMPGEQRNQIIDSLAPAGSPKGGPPIPAAHPPANFDQNPRNYNPGEGKPGGYPEALRPVGNMGRTALNDFTSLPGNIKSAVTTPQKSSVGDAFGNLIAGPAYGPAKSLLQSTKQSYDEGGLEKAATDTGGHLLAAGLTEGTGRALNSIPRAARANAKFSMLESKLADQPVPLTRSAPHLQNLAEQDAAGPSMPTTANKLLNRSQAIEPMDYRTARRFQSNLSDLTPEDLNRMNGMMKGGVKQLRGGLFEDIKNAADTKGLGEDYASAMKESRQAHQLKAGSKAVGKAALGAAGGYGGYRLYKDVTGR